MSVQDESSLSRMRTLQFNDKMSTLNRDFLKSLRIWYEQCPHYDFSDTVGSYLKHVAGLEKQYGLKTEDEQENGVTDENRPLKENGGDRKIAKARRRLPKDSSKLNDSVAVSTPARVPPRFSLGNVSAIAPTETPEMAPMEPPSTQGGRKRVIRGGGPNNERESVHFRGSDASANTIEVPPVTIQLPKPSAGFWDKHKDESHQGTMPRFNIVKPAAEVLPPGLEKKDESPFAFGKADTREVEPSKVEEVAKKETESVEKPKATSPILFGSKTSSEPAKPGFSFGNFNTSKTESTDAAASKPAVSFPVFGAKKEGEE